MDSRPERHFFKILLISALGHLCAGIGYAVAKSGVHMLFSGVMLSILTPFYIMPEFVYVWVGRKFIMQASSWLSRVAILLMYVLTAGAIGFLLAPSAGASSESIALGYGYAGVSFGSITGIIMAVESHRRKRAQLGAQRNIESAL